MKDSYFDRREEEVMLVYDVMSKGAECIRPNASLKEAAERMKQLDVGALPVCDNDHLAGMITDRDITIRSVAEGHDPRSDRVKDIMTAGIVYCFDDQEVTEAAELMCEKQIRRLPVLNRDKRLVGIVSLGDLAIEAGDDALCGHALEGVSEPAGIGR
jgi:CBS domain-containing protein